MLDAQLRRDRAGAAGRPLERPHDAAVRAITQGLVTLGLLKGGADEIVEKAPIERFYMHRTGHWLGMDVHDVGDYKVGGEWRVLEPGMVLTVEPGIYMPPTTTNGAGERWRGIGIRIEDDVLGDARRQRGADRGRCRKRPSDRGVAGGTLSTMGPGRSNRHAGGSPRRCVMHFVPHRVEDREGAGQAQPEDP